MPFTSSEKDNHTNEKTRVVKTINKKSDNNQLGQELDLNTPQKPKDGYYYHTLQGR
ncbi:hypothetical protein [Photorhabdus namnaonensis]|uniref:Uncharacterized protein n=1 Tax=Photorhabdus namnaonensis TaxID=1851568 RepID=A0A1B8YGL2_9GAMM|nr:hypothetical protein [Photorhabdus namnaonensis]OCA54294.1 hypothetical protein Phpb_02738 [Photorhabdus namnaonensis]